MSERIAINPGFSRMQGLPFSSGVKVGDFIFVSGQVPVSRDGVYAGDDLASQTRQVFTNIGEILIEAGATFDDVAFVTAHLTFDIQDRQLVEEYFAVRSEFITHHAYAGSGFQVVSLHDPRFLLQVDTIAVA